MITTGENLKGVSGVYCATHRETGMVYIGSSLNIGKRRKRHLSDAQTGSMNEPKKKETK
jgi:predicted GIY-YIG superfamily endonuclease